MGSPEWQFNLTARYEHDIGHGFQAFGQAHTVYNSDIQYGVNANPLSIQKAYDLVDFTTGVGPTDRKWLLSFYLRNAFNTRFASRISLANPTINQTFTFDAVRSAGMSLDLAF